MDIQLKKGLLDICILRVLKQGDSYGYQIVKDVMEYVEVSESTLYPILKRLEASACLTTYSVAHQGRLRKYYQITPKGVEKIDVFLKEWHQIEKIYTFIKGED